MNAWRLSTLDKARLVRMRDRYRRGWLPEYTPQQLTFARLVLLLRWLRVHRRIGGAGDGEKYMRSIDVS